MVLVTRMRGSSSPSTGATPGARSPSLPSAASDSGGRSPTTPTDPAKCGSPPTISRPGSARARMRPSRAGTNVTPGGRHRRRGTSRSPAPTRSTSSQVPLHGWRRDLGAVRTDHGCGQLDLRPGRSADRLRRGRRPTGCRRPPTAVRPGRSRTRDWRACPAARWTSPRPIRCGSTRRSGTGPGIYRSDDGTNNWTFLPIEGSIGVWVVREDPSILSVSTCQPTLAST